MRGETTSTTLLYSYLIFTMFLLAVFTLTGESIFGENFPNNPLTATNLNLSPLPNESIIFYAGRLIWILITLPLSFLTYIFLIFAFFIISPVYWWLDVIFIPATVIILYFVIRLVIDLINAIGQWIPFT